MRTGTGVGTVGRGWVDRWLKLESIILKRGEKKQWLRTLAKRKRKRGENDKRGTEERWKKEKGGKREGEKVSAGGGGGEN